VRWMSSFGLRQSQNSILTSRIIYFLYEANQNFIEVGQNGAVPWLTLNYFKKSKTPSDIQTENARLRAAIAVRSVIDPLSHI